MTELKLNPSTEQAKQIRELENTGTLRPDTVKGIFVPATHKKIAGKVKLPHDLLTQGLQHHTLDTIETAIAATLESLLRKPA